MKPIFNIFSKKQTKQEKKDRENQKNKIIIDFREKNSLIPSELLSLGHTIEFKHLQVADYIVNGVAIERKTISDLKGSIINKRIFQQIKEIKQFPKHLLLIEGLENNNDIYNGIIHENAMRGFILSSLLEAQIPIVFTMNDRDTARYLSVLSKRDPNKEISLRQKIPMNKEEQKQFILEGFPGIGPTTAKALIKKFKTLKNIFNADEKELAKILKTKTNSFKQILED